MAHDFAKQRNNPDGSKRKRERAVTRTTPQSGNANWSWFFSGLMSGVIISIVAYLAVLKLEEGVAESAQSVQAGTSPEEQPTYTFYEELTKAEVAVNLPATDAPDTGAATTTTNATVATETPAVATQSAAATEQEKPPLYLVQAGSFQNREDGESRRARITLLNMNANIVESVVGGRTLYRVQVGPFTGHETAEDARNILSGNEIESILMVVPP